VFFQDLEWVGLGEKGGHSQVNPFIFDARSRAKRRPFADITLAENEHGTA
jgi:hypothetical protein